MQYCKYINTIEIVLITNTFALFHELSIMLAIPNCLVLSNLILQ